MKRLSVPLLALVVIAVACSDDDSGKTGPTTTAGSAAYYPVTVSIGGEDVTIAERPERIVSLSPSATETLFAIGAGDQVVAVDEFSTHPVEAPRTDLSGFTPNIEAIASYDPDLIVVSFDPESIITEAFAPLGVPVIKQFPATGRDDLLAQVEQLGVITQHVDDAIRVTGEIAGRWDAANEVDAGGATVYIEVDSTFYSASSNSFMGSALAPMGFVNIADPADEAGFGFPQLSAEAIIEASPDLIILGTDSGLSADDVASRPGWDVINAVANDRVIVVDSDLSSRWGPRFVEFVELIAELASSLEPVGS